MSTSTRVAAFVGALGVTFALALGIGNAFGPDAEPAAAAHDAHGPDTSADSQAASPDPAQMPGGLMVSQAGYTFALTRSTASAGAKTPVPFTITGPDSKAVTSYDTEHDKQLHLIAVRRDFTGFQHAHPQLLSDGTWSIGLDLTPGQWRLFADFTATGGAALTLGADLAVPGVNTPIEQPEETRTAQVDGYTVTLDGDLTAGADAKLTLAVNRNGKPVTDLEPYLGAFGHLVALRAGDLAYLHVHPDGAPDDGSTRPGPDVVFHAGVPSAGTYHLFLDFKHQGVVRTAAFTVTADGSAASSADASEDAHSGH